MVEDGTEKDCDMSEVVGEIRDIVHGMSDQMACMTQQIKRSNEQAKQWSESVKTQPNYQLVESLLDLYALDVKGVSQGTLKGKGTMEVLLYRETIKGWWGDAEEVEVTEASIYDAIKETIETKGLEEGYQFVDYIRGALGFEF